MEKKRYRGRELTGFVLHGLVKIYKINEDAIFNYSFHSMLIFPV